MTKEQFSFCKNLIVKNKVCLNPRIDLLSYFYVFVSDRMLALAYMVDSIKRFSGKRKTI